MLIMSSFRDSVLVQIVTLCLDGRKGDRKMDKIKAVSLWKMWKGPPKSQCVCLRFSIHQLDLNTFCGTWVPVIFYPGKWTSGKKSSRKCLQNRVIGSNPTHTTKMDGWTVAVMFRCFSQSKCLNKKIYLLKLDLAACWSLLMAAEWNQMKNSC